MKKSKKRSYINLAVGLTVIALAIVGIISIISGASELFTKRLEEENSAKYAAYEEFIAPVIMNDPDTFDDISNANISQLISISIWSLIEENSEPDAYEYVDSGILIPQKDVEKKFGSLFGSDVTLRHCTVDGGEGIEFRYSESRKGYVIPITGITPIYIPKVTSAKVRENTVILTVSYLASEQWVQDSEGNMVEPEASKVMEITLFRNQDGSYNVRAIRLV